MKVILASKSPRRVALMELGKFDFEVMPSEADEKVNNIFDLEEVSKEIAFKKAKDVFDNTQGDRTIIGADTLVVKNGKSYGKPKDRSDAIKMLRELQGEMHTVYTGLTILIEYKEKYKEYKELIKTNVYLKKMSDEEIIDYIDSEEPFDKAGSYGIQTSFSVFVEKIEGDYTGILGLPISRVYEILKENEII